jgi:hypothetical protein
MGAEQDGNHHVGRAAASAREREGLWADEIAQDHIACPRLHKQTTGDRSDEPPD